MPTDRVCGCANPMTLIKAFSCIWRLRCNRYGSTASWKANTYFSGNHYTITSILLLALCWWLNIPITAASCFTSLNPEGVSMSYRDFRRCSTLMLLHQGFVLGRPRDRRISFTVWRQFSKSLLTSFDQKCIGVHPSARRDLSTRISLSMFSSIFSIQ